MPRTSKSSFDSLLRDVISTTLRDELSGVRSEIAALRAEIARRGVGAGASGKQSSTTSSRRGARATGRQRGGQRLPGTMSASQVKDIRSRLGVSQKRFAELTGVTPVAVYFWESGRTTPSVDREKTLLKLSASAPGAKAASGSKSRKKAGKRGRRK